MGNGCGKTQNGQVLVSWEHITENNTLVVWEERERKYRFIRESAQALKIYREVPLPGFQKKVVFSTKEGYLGNSSHAVSYQITLSAKICENTKTVINTSISDSAKRFFSSWLRCWSTAGQSPLSENASTRCSNSQRRTDGGVLLSKSTAEPLRADREAGFATGISDARRLEGAEPPPPLGWLAISSRHAVWILTPTEEIFHGILALRSCL